MLRCNDQTSRENHHTHRDNRLAPQVAGLQWLKRGTFEPSASTAMTITSWLCTGLAWPSCFARHCPQFISGAAKNRCPVASHRLTQEARARIPGHLFPVLLVAPFRDRWQDRPYRRAERSGKMHHCCLHRNHEIKRSNKSCRFVIIFDCFFPCVDCYGVTMREGLQI